jgi:hypothetical protein
MSASGYLGHQLVQRQIAGKSSDWQVTAFGVDVLYQFVSPHMCVKC